MYNDFCFIFVLVSISVQALYLAKNKFVCRYCEKRFARQLHLDDHERIHTGEKPYFCHFCKQGFRQKTNLKTHMWKVHKENLSKFM